MPRLSPFRGLVFDAAVAGPLARVTAPPYDVISDDRRLEYLRASPYSVVHLDLAEGHVDPSHPESRYARAADLVASWEADGVLRRADAPSFYVYEMRPPGRDGAIRGVIGAMTLEDWGGSVVPHEQVGEAPVQDRLALLRATHTHLSPVYGTIAGSDGALDALIGGVVDAPAPFEAMDEGSVRHRMWPVEADPDALDHLVGERLLIADGHHRYTTALRFRDERRIEHGPGPWDAVLTLVVDAAAEHLDVLPFHRVQGSGTVPDPEGLERPDLAATLEALADDPPTVGVVTRSDDRALAFHLRSLDGGPPAVRALHASMLDEIDPAELRFVPDAGRAVDAVAAGEAVAAYLLPPTTPDRIEAVIERGERLPRKSTYFWPKPRTGMVMMPLADPPRPAGRGDRAS